MRMRTFFWILGIVAVIYTLVTGDFVQAAPSGLPSAMTSGSADISKVDKGLTEYLNWAVYFAYIAGSISVGSGIVLASPIVAKRDAGRNWIMGGIFTALGGAFLHLILSIVGNVVK